MAFDVHKVRADFPILRTEVHGKPLVYLDNGATTQKPRAVIDAIVDYYTTSNANIHRGVYELSQRATEGYESARRKVARFINASDEAECIFVRGTTEGINLVAASWARANLRPGDEVLVGGMEHHSNIVPWQLACEATGAKLQVIPMNADGELELDQLPTLLHERTKLVAVQHVSNAVGTVQDVERIIARAKQVEAKVLIDGAQWVAHFPTDVQALGCDFYTFSGHKLFGPTGVGVLWGRRALLESMSPYHGGGDMIETVTFEKSTYAPIPNKFEAGTPDIAGAIGLGAAIDYVVSVGFENFVPHEEELLHYAAERLQTVPGLRIIGRPKRRAGVLSFVFDQPRISSMDVGIALDREGVAVRTGHHCCMPIMTKLGIDSTTRASFAMYNTREDVDALVTALHKVARAHHTRAAGVVAPPTMPRPLVDVTFAQPSAPSPQAAAEELAQDFDLFDDREARGEYVLDLAKTVPSQFDTLKLLTARVPGCMSEVYLIGRPSPSSKERLEFTADANADIVRGLIAILQRIYSGQRAQDVLAFDINRFFTRIGLEQFISSQRRNGLAGMIGRIRQQAQSIAQQQ